MTQPGSIASGMPADEDSLMRRVADLERTVRELGPSVASSFNSTVGELADLLANQVVPFANSSSNSDFTVTTSDTIFATVAVSVPAGYSRALVYAGGSLSASQNLNGGRLHCRVRIAGSDGPTTTGLVTTSWPYSSIAAFSTRNLGGLAGDSFTVELRAFFSHGSTDPALRLWNTASLAAQVLFMR